MGFGQLPAQVTEYAVRVAPGRYLHQDLDLVADALLRVQMDLELVDLGELAHDGLDRPRVDVRPPHQLHVVHPAADPAVVDVERAPARTVRTGDLHHEVPRP